MKITSEEKAVVATLADAWNQFVRLKPVHDWEQREFMHAIHEAQCIILARPAAREMQLTEPTEEKIPTAKKESDR